VFERLEGSLAFPAQLAQIGLSKRKNFGPTQQTKTLALMVAMSEIVKPVLFEAVVLIGFVAWALLGLWVDALLGLRMILAWPYNYLGIVPVLGGVALRFWASSTIFNTGNGTPLYTRPAKALVMTGPYRLIRNPLYLGGFMIYLGIVMAIPSPFLATLGLIGLPIIYIGITREEKGLQGRFGEDCRRYKQNVPGWIPRIKRSTPP